MTGVPCNRLAASLVARDRHKLAIAHFAFENLNGISSVTAQFGAARIIRRAAILNHSHTKRLSPAATDVCAATRGELKTC